MSKYNLTDIFEQYQIGSGHTRDFDFEGMLNAGLKIDTDTPIEVMKKISDDFRDVNYHRENNYLQGAIDALEAGDVFEANGKLNDFRHVIKNTMATLGMDMSDDLGAYMASKMDVDESFDSLAKKLDKQKGIDKDEAAKIAGKIANIKRKGGGKGPTAKQKKRMSEMEEDIKENKIKMMDDNQLMKLVRKNNVEAAEELAARDYLDDEDVIKVKNGEGKDLANTEIHQRISRRDNKKKRMNEVRIDREVANRIESFLNIPMKAKFLDAWEDLFYDLVDDEPFYVDDVIAHLSNEMSKRINGNQIAGDRLAGIDDFEQEEFTAIDEEGAMQPGEADLEAGVKGNMDAFTEGKEVDFIRALKVDANGTSLEIKSYLESLKRSGDKFDSVDDYVEDFKNYVADKSLQEHFGRFLKDYQ